MGNSPFRTGPLAVPNRYQVSPSLAIEGSCVYCTSPSSFNTCGLPPSWPGSTAVMNRTRTSETLNRAPSRSAFKKLQTLQVLNARKRLLPVALPMREIHGNKVSHAARFQQGLNLAHNAI